MAKLTPKSKQNEEKDKAFDSTLVKICLNCGDILLEKAQKCPTCGKKEKALYLIDKSDKDTICEIKNSVPNPKGTEKPKWQTNPMQQARRMVL